MPTTLLIEDGHLHRWHWGASQFLDNVIIKSDTLQVRPGHSGKEADGVTVHRRSCPIFAESL